MKCVHPVTAWKPLPGSSDMRIKFSEVKDSHEIQLRCGQCIHCRLLRREWWTIRCFLESKMHPVNSFLTLTYNDANLPEHGSLDYKHFQLFMKKLRHRVIHPIRFFMCGEYGGQFGRPHYHALLFGYNFADRVQDNSVYSKEPVYKSKLLNELWGRGDCKIGDVSYASARYCAAYTVEKITGDLADKHYMRVSPATGEVVWVEPEFAHMSLRPGIGAKWLEKYWRDLYKTGHNAVIVNGQKKAIPKYFDERMDDIVPLLMDEVEYKRYLESLKYSGDNTPDRLAAIEACTLARLRFNEERKVLKKCDTRLLP